MNIGILTFHNAYNSGAMLQAWALKAVLERMGHKVSFPDYNSVGREPRFKILNGRRSWGRFSGFRIWMVSLVVWAFSIGTCDVTRFLFKRFQKRWLTVVSCSSHEWWKKYDCFIVGSDQVWNEELIGDEIAHFLGEDIPHGIPLLGYGISMGDKKPSKSSLKRILRAISKFDFVSFRESYARDFLGDKNLVSAISVVLDPTLLLSASDYENFAQSRRIKGDYLYVYAGPPTQNIVQLASKMAQHLGLKLVVTPVYQYSRVGSVSGLRYDIAPDTFCSFMKFAKAAVVASFHGTAFALQYRIPFVNVSTTGVGEANRVGALLSAIGETWRQVPPIISERACLERLTVPIKSSSYETLITLRETSLACLNEALGRVRMRG